MVNSSNLTKGHIVYFVGEVLSKAIFFVLLPFLGNSISISEFGVFSLLFPLIQYLLSTASFGLSTSLFRYFFEKDVSKDAVFSSTLLSWLLSAICWYPIFFLLLYSTPISQYHLYKYHLSNFVAPLLISLLCLGFGQIVTELFRVQKKATLFVILNFFSRFIIVIALLITVYLGYLSSISLLWATATGSIIVFTYSLIIYLMNLKFSIDWVLVKKLTYFGYPVMLTPISALFLYLGNRYVLNYLVSADEVGIYSMAVSLVQIVALIPAAFSRAWVPELFSRLSEGTADESFFKKIVSHYLFVFIFFCLSFELCSKMILLAVGGVKYLSALPLFPILLSGFILEVYYTFSIDRLCYAKRMPLVFLLSTFSGVFNVIISFATIMLFGKIGAALAFTVSILIQAILFAVAAQKIDRIRLPHKELLCYVLLGIIGCNLIWYALNLGTWAGAIGIYFIMMMILVFLFKQDYVTTKKIMLLEPFPLVDKGFQDV